MKMSKYISVSVGAALILATLAASPLWGARPPVTRPNLDGEEGNGGVRIPAPITVDQITHDMGNIVTTVDNYGYVGGYSYYNLPSGEWPRNSGHDYLAEIKYWMGDIGTANDTMVANTEDDFQGVPSLVSGQNEYKILLSTDTARYFDYDPTDTVGLGNGNAANGWREYSLDSTGWVYTRNYNPLDSTFFSGGPISLQESHFRFNDAASGSPLMGLELTHTMLQWNYCYNEDFIFVILEIKNTSAVDYPNFAFGIYCDYDVGGPDGTGENGRLGDLVAFDSSENLAWTYDADGFDPGWGPTVTTGIMGTKYLETPQGIGMTSFRTGDWDAVSNIDDAGRFALINSTNWDTSLPPTDQYYIQCTRGINLTAGSTVRVVYALVAGADETEFRANAALAQELYDNYFVGPEPPVTPTLSARPADRKVYLHWNDTAEVGLDPLTGQQDFVGYKLYRSDNHGKTWGKVNYQTGNSCLTVDYTPLALYTVSTPGEPIPHSFIDTGLSNGVEYWYCLSAFDMGDTVTGVDPLQSGFGVAGSARNVTAITPHNNPAGFYDAAGTVEHTYTGLDVPSEGTVMPIVFDRNALQGAEYEVSFEDTPERTYWYLINTTTGDTVLARQDKENLDPGLFDVAEGIQLVVNNADRTPSGWEQTSFAGVDTTLGIMTFFGNSAEIFTGEFFGDASYRSTYELRYTGDSTLAPNAADPGYVLYTFPFEVWNTTTNQRISLAVYDGTLDGIWDHYNTVMIVNYPYNPAVNLFDSAFPYYFSWIFKLDTFIYNPQIGEVLRIDGAHLNGPDDHFAFKVDGINAAAAANDLKKIRVVPDPYFVQYSSMVETSEGQSVLEFQKVPDRCTIRIYTLGGDLVQTIEHNDGTGAARWDLLSSNSQQVSSGIYIYHVDSPYGEHIGRFSVIK
ncbi:MAG: hypothetical protein AB1644_03190 [Candidatus Zixiibacteriota bacterium]